MTAPYVRVWLLQRAEEIRDTFCDIWYTFRPAINEFWDNVPFAYRHLELPGAGTEEGPRPAFHLLLRCRTCRAHVGAPCVTSDGHVTTPHKVRRQS